MAARALALLAAIAAAGPGPALAPSAEERYLEGSRLLEAATAATASRAERRQGLAAAEAALADAVAQEPERWQHHNALGEVHLAQERWETAAQSFLTVTQLDNQVASAFLKLGLSLSRVPGYEEKSAEARLIAARLNTDFADLNERWESRAASRVVPASEVAVQAPPLGPPLAILVPYRDRAAHLEKLVPALSKLLRKRKLRATIFVVEQGNAKEWNKGIVYNAGFDHVRRRYGAECFAFHDVDFIPKRAA